MQASTGIYALVPVCGHECVSVRVYLFFIKKSHIIYFLENSSLSESFESNFDFLLHLVWIFDCFAIFDKKIEDFNIFEICSFAIPINKNVI